MISGCDKNGYQEDNCQWLLIINPVKSTQEVKIESADDGLKLPPKMAKMKVGTFLIMSLPYSHLPQDFCLDSHYLLVLDRAHILSRLNFTKFEKCELEQMTSSNNHESWSSKLGILQSIWNLAVSFSIFSSFFEFGFQGNAKC